MWKSRKVVVIGAVRRLLTCRNVREKLSRQAKDERWSSSELGKGERGVGVVQTQSMIP
jgi:hypothetical protein